MKKRKYLIFALFIILLPIHAKKNPDWILNPYKNFDSSKYIAEVGSASSIEEATNIAYSSISAVLKQDIDATEVVTQSDVSNGKTLTTYLTNVKTNTSIQNISGLSVKEKYFDKKQKKYYVLAVLNKSNAAKYYSLLISKNSIEVDTLIESSKQQKGTFDAPKYLIKAYKIACENDEYLDLLNTLKPDSKKILSYGNKYELLSLINNSLSDINIFIEKKENSYSNSTIENAIGKAINNFGINYSYSESDKNNYSISYDIKFEEVNKNESLEIYFTRYILSITLTDNINNSKILTYTKNARIGKLSKAESEKAALRAAEKIIQEEFLNKLQALLE